MEEVLDLYEEPYDEARPKVCFDETNKQLIGEKRLPDRGSQPATTTSTSAEEPSAAGSIGSSTRSAVTAWYALLVY